MIIELHLLQSFPVSNLNRDDIGQPKTVRFGGATRARISSQSMKKAARDRFNKYGLEESELGDRTKLLPEKAAEKLAEQRGCDQEYAHRVAAVGLESLGIGVDSELKSKYLLFINKETPALLARHCDEIWDSLTDVINRRDAEDAKRKKNKADGKAADRTKKIPVPPAKKKADEILKGVKAADIALFGRMIADNKDFSVNSASQVAHALSTHAVANEFDYYTALDDLKPEATPGADMIGTVDFNAACYYRYANLDLGQLGNNFEGLDGDILERSIRAWLLAFINAVPGGKQNSMAARSAPDVLLGVVRTDGAWGLANAFLEPVGDVSNIMATSASGMNRYFDQIRDFYGDDDIAYVTYGSLGANTDNVVPPAGAVTAAGQKEFVAGLLTAAQADK